MRQIVYFSTAAAFQDATTVAAILTVSRERNARDAITGLLVAGGHRYLQVIEGGDDVMEALVSRICRDERHVSVSILVDREVEESSFPDWSMAYCAEPHLGEFATFSDMIDRTRAHVTNRKLRRQIECFARSFALPPARLVPSPWTMTKSYLV